ncbi:LysR family transcriptional regulator [Xylophilus rhododendri]|uniref:LysR family transcriptional regulator n=1 Tax=Xylophilus rhododendri TaxID=2697032 RepID=A0A857J3C0_9BURK|nr:LysR substrate-binding domain-containing protein [Xylophilus rhododendri]QHI98424.1 LysR family transcriptional regulator [Xylophilus rhododendri]
MELRQFKYFLAIVDSGSLSRAGQHLYVAQSALSKQMADLEAELGAQLLVRSRNGVTATEAGQIFYEYAQGITKQIGDARSAVHCSANAMVGSVLTALPQSVAAPTALPLMRAAASRFPDVNFHLNEELTGNMADQLLRGRVDVGIFSKAMSPDDVEFIPLVEEDFVLLCSAQDPQAPGAPTVTLEEAIARPLVLPGRAHGHCTRTIVETVLIDAGKSMPKVAAEINSVHILKTAIQAGLGSTIMPYALAQREVEDGRLTAHKIDSPDLHRTLGVCVSRHLPMTNAKQAIRRLIADVFRDLCTSGRWPGARVIPGVTVD